MVCESRRAHSGHTSTILDAKHFLEWKLCAELKLSEALTFKNVSYSVRRRGKGDLRILEDISGPGPGCLSPSPFVSAETVSVEDYCRAGSTVLGRCLFGQA